MKFITGLFLSLLLAAVPLSVSADHQAEIDSFVEQDGLVKSLNPKEPNLYFGLRIMQKHLYPISQYSYHPVEDVHRFVIETAPEFATTCIFEFSRSKAAFGMVCDGPNPPDPRWFQVTVTSSDHAELRQLLERETK